MIRCTHRNINKGTANLQMWREGIFRCIDHGVLVQRRHRAPGLWVRHSLREGDSRELFRPQLSFHKVEPTCLHAAHHHLETE